MADDLNLELLPSDDEGLSPDEELAAAVAGAVAEPNAIVPQTEDAPTPLGRTWAFDWSLGQFVRSGNAPAPTSGFGAISEYVQMVAHSARYAHRVFSDQFGMEGPEEPLGELTDAEIISDYEQHLREGVLVHERITALDKFSASFDGAAGVLVIAYFEIVTDEDGVISFSDLTLETS